ncbi:MAG: DNA polymerase I [Betaproteobacteria bacterium]|nr:DNA polymerase I [Betaproteobacteria bacterium]
MATLVLVDGSSYLYRAFHALPDLRTSKGEPTGALRGVLSMLRRLVIDGKPDYFAVVFDAPGKTFRDAWYPEYKANRPPMPDALVAQIEPLHEAVRANGWPLLVVDGVEADDVIGTLARQAKAAGIDTVISTSDKDLAQLVEPGITLINTMTGERLDHDGVVARFGVRPDQVLDLLTLTGDVVDNVPGVPKVGPKTAAKWLAQYGTLDEVVAHADEIGGVVGANLRNARDWLPEGRRLLTVKVDCDLPARVDDLRLGAPDADRMRALYERFEFKSWLRDDDRQPETDAAGKLAARAARDDAGRRWDEDTKPPAHARAAPPVRYETVVDVAALERWLAAIATADLVSFDTETTSLDPMQADIVGLSLSIEPTVACYIPLGHRYAGAPGQLDAGDVLRRLAPWLADPARPKLGQNLKYDQHVLANRGVALRGVAQDTLLESYVLESHRPHDMDSLARRHLDLATITYDDVTGKGAKRIPFEQVSIERATEYAAEDADVTLRLHLALYPRIEQDAKLRRVYETIEMPVREILFRMEREGVLIDRDLLARQSQALGARALALEQQAHALAGGPFNLGSPKQLSEILYERMKLPVRKKTATGQPSTDEDVLEALAADYPLPRVLLEYRALTKLKSTYTDKLPTMVNARTGRVHTTYSQATAVTGRLASVDPNLQNIPVRTADGRRIREAFIAPAGRVLVSADYSQIELRIMAHLSEDPALLKAFHEGADIHRATASEIFGVAPADVTPDQRRYIKAVNFGLIYGMGAFGLASQLNIERGAAQQYIDRYFARYPGVAAYMQRTRELAREQGYVETVFGRRLVLSDINAGGGPRRAAAERAAINAPMQGTAADLIKLAMIAVQAHIDRDKLGARLIMQVHDELVLEVPEAELADVLRELPRLMTGVAELRVPLAVEVGHGPNWEQAH